MKAIVTIATVVFLAVIGSTHLLAANAPAVPATRAPTERTLTMAEVSAHAAPSSCWMVIDGVVYDFTAYLPKHPADPKSMLKYCGREATQGFRTKDAGRPHSQYAQQLLSAYRIGLLKR